MVDINWNTPPYYVRQAHFDSDRMAGSIPAWKQGAESGTGQAEGVLAMTEDKTTPAEVTAPSFSFGELLDIVNPLQHIPVVNKYYRNLTGDKISPVAQIIGGGLYGGAIGGVASLVNAAIHEHSGHDTATAVASAFKGGQSSAYGFAEDSRTAGLTGEKREPQETRVAQSVDHKADKQPQYHLNT